MEKTHFPGEPERSDPRDGPSMHFPNPKVVRILKRPALEEKYLIAAGSKFVIPDLDAMVNRLPLGHIAI